MSKGAGRGGSPGRGGRGGWSPGRGGRGWSPGRRHWSPGRRFPPNWNRSFQGGRWWQFGNNYVPYSFYSQYLYPISDNTFPTSFQDCCLASGYSPEACSNPGIACPVALNAIASGGGDNASATVASYCCPIAYRQWGYGYSGPYY